MLEQAVKIILVEDDPGHARLIEKNLRRSNVGKEIIVMYEGQQAMQFLFHQDESAGLQKQAPLIVLLDLNLQGIDGYQILQKIKSSPRTCHIPVIILTTTDDQHEARRCYDLGCNAYITKPIDYEQFSAIIGKLVQFLSIITVPCGD